MSDGQLPPRRPPRVGDTSAPVTTIMVLAVAAVAVIAGFLILRSITDPDAGSDDVASDAATTTINAPQTTTGMTLPNVETTTTTSTTTTTIVPIVPKSAATVVVANASGLDGSATAMTSALTADGYKTIPVANATGPRLEQSIIYYLQGDRGSLGVARLLAEQIPSARTLPMPQPPPLDRPLNGATVALLLGKDAAGRPLAELQAD